MASVWLARMRGKRGFEKLFAVKTIRTELVEDPRFQEMFLDEARIASGIQHPNVAQILDLGEQHDVLFIVMEWVDGDSLAKIRKLSAKQQVAVPLGIALRALADACAGLHAAHELRDEHDEPLGIVHRDVSPQNILVSASGTVKVIDFGIAKAHNRRQGETGTGVVKGKIQYMAPEQVKKGRVVDRRTDVWALGVCLHELVSARFPNDGDDDVEVIRKLLADEPPVRVPGLPDPVVRILDRSLVLDPDDRFPTAAGMQRALESAMKELGDVATSDDVAAFLRTSLPELAERRRGLIASAIEDARDRGEATRRDSSGDEVAFAATVIREESSGARKTSEGPPIALTKRKVVEVEAAPETIREPNARPLWPSVDSIPPRIPKRGAAGMWTGALVGLVGLAGAALVVRATLPTPVPASPAALSAATASSPGPSAPSAEVPSPVDSSTAALPESPPISPFARPHAALDALEPRPPVVVVDASVDASALVSSAPALDAQPPSPDALPPPAASSSAVPSPDDDPNNPYN
jgi:serine/threonine protein kinase